MTTKKTPKKTDALTLRLDPRAKFLIELMSRLGHQTITGVIESAISRLANDRKVGLGGQDVALTVASEMIWSPVESERVVNLALHAPALLNHEESCISTVLETANVIFFNIHEIRSSADLEYRAHDIRAMRGCLQQMDDGRTVYVTPKRKVIRLAWDLIKSRAAELAEKGVCPDLSIDEVENFIGKPLSSIKSDVKAPGVVILDDDGIAYLGSDKESDDLIESLGGKP